MIELFEGDFLDVLPQVVQPHSVQLVVTDLPYGITDKRSQWNNNLVDLPKFWECMREILVPNGAVVMTSAMPFTIDLINSNRKWFKYELIWRKPFGTKFFHAKRRPLCNHGMVLVFSMGKTMYNPQMTNGKPYTCHQKEPCVNYSTGADGYTTHNPSGTRHPLSILDFPTPRPKLHPTQKPVELFRWLIRTYSNPGDLVVDPCMGAATAAIACMDEGRDFIGVELYPPMFKIARDRVDGYMAKTASDAVPTILDKR